ncbi:MAG: N-acetyltransferase [Rubricoccaceae bacterium]|nr:N-acetyltransferase [Rubricoccaceae bacterium]
MIIRDEAHEDFATIRAINESAFDTSSEADLVDLLRLKADPIVSLLAEKNNEVVGHIMFSPVTLDHWPNLKLMGLAPMAVIPEYQRTGVGSALVQKGLDKCRHLGIGAVFVLGHPEYYPRFGFLPSSTFGIDCEYDVPAELFMAQELADGYLGSVSGTIRYHKAFLGV